MDCNGLHGRNKRNRPITERKGNMPYYKPLIAPTFTMERHVYWASDFIMTQPDKDNVYTDIRDKTSDMEKEYGLDLSQFWGTTNIRTCLRNMVKPEDGKFIFEQLTKGKK